MRTVRSVLIAVAVLFAFGFGLPVAFHRITCEVFTIRACAISPYPEAIGFLSAHRTVWLLSAVAYAVAVVLVFRGEVVTAFTSTRAGLQVRLIAGLLALVLCLLALALLHE